MANPAVELVLQALWPPSGEERTASESYALLDGARDPRIYRMLRGSLVDSCCLYEGDLPRDLAEVAPYLVALGRSSPFTVDLIEQGWGRSWGVFLSCPAIMQDLRRHFRRLLQVRDEAGRRLLFRFYDPRVLRAYLPTCRAEELRFVFGPVDRLVVEGESGIAPIVYRRTRDGLATDVVDLPRPRSDPPGPRIPPMDI